MGSAHDFAPLDSVEARRDLQARVCRFAGVLFWLGAALTVASTLAHHAAEHASEGAGLAHQAIHVIAALPAAAVWFWCRRRPMSVALVEVVDVALTMTTCTVDALLGFSAPGNLSVACSVVLALSYTLVGRSIIVPSTFRRTFWISAVGAIPTLALLVTQVPPRAFGGSTASGHVFTAFSLLWCAFAVLAATANSRELYGLRATIREIGKLGQYTLEEKIGEGGMGVVYKATHAMLRRPAAIKLLSKDRSSEKDQLRFEREVQLTSGLRHPNTVSIFDYGRTSEGLFYYVMEYLDGLDLEQLVARHGPVDAARAIHVLRQVCGSLGEAHALDLVHRDIKPANIVLMARVDEPDVVKVVDFGLARTLERNTDESRVGVLTGTPLYLAPEAITNPEATDARSDIYALGAVGYFLLAGRNVFEGNSVVEVLGRHVLEAPRPPSSHLARPLPTDLEAVIMQCLAKDRNARPASAASLSEALLSCADSGRYDRNSALAWWRERSAGQQDAHAAGDSPATMTIDLAALNRDDPSASA
jgi:eukaryotic-like serine/threonine-protein kinase